MKHLLDESERKSENFARESIWESIWGFSGMLITNPKLTFRFSNEICAKSGLEDPCVIPKKPQLHIGYKLHP